MTPRGPFDLPAPPRSDIASSSPWTCELSAALRSSTPLAQSGSAFPQAQHQSSVAPVPLQPSGTPVPPQELWLQLSHTKAVYPQSLRCRPVTATHRLHPSPPPSSPPPLFVPGHSRLPACLFPSLHQLLVHLLNLCHTTVRGHAFSEGDVTSHLFSYLVLLFMDF